MYQPTPTYWLERTDLTMTGLRRYTSPDGDSPGGMTCAQGWHSALTTTGTAIALWKEDQDGNQVLGQPPATDPSDPRWPATCRCGYRFVAADEHQDWRELVYKRADTGEFETLRGVHSEVIGDGYPPPAGPGATWDAWWMPDDWRGGDGISLMVRLPNGHDWQVDSRAANCTMPDDDVHRCWVRHGDPRQANVTVDKNGVTCAAGAGSILACDYHGFLQGGVLTAG